MRMRTLSVIAVPVLIVLAACESGTAPARELSDEDLRDIALALDQVAAGALPGGGGPSFDESPVGDGDFTRSFTFTASCPVSGTLTVAATSEGNFDFQAESFSVTTTATLTHAQCGIRTRRGMTVTVNGDPNLVSTSSFAFVKGQPVGPHTTTQKGRFTYTTSTGVSGTCVIDVTASMDPVTRTLTMSGTSCGRTISFTSTRGR